MIVACWFLRDIQKQNLSLVDADEEPSNLFNIPKSSNKIVNQVEKRSFLNNIRLFFSAIGKILNNYIKYKNKTST